ncbi:MAG: hypothetical protein QF673_04790 [Candidatus Hydrothermarchaeota archaeon]|jgi:hypothetical protein|nr:hypothetical protein [Candidatus Hydrothermarchaeota archaeon]
MDLLKAFEFLMKKDIRVMVTSGGKELIEVTGRDGNIDLSIKDEDTTIELVRELRKWKS